jgi:anaerobic selenocysteine-containing dehydrogenase
MTLVRRGAQVEVTSRDFVTNKGGLCRKGWTAAELLEAPDRLTAPLVRRGEKLEPATWPEAIGFVASSIERCSSATDRIRSASSAAAGSPMRRRTCWASSPAWCCGPATSTTMVDTAWLGGGC